jgi:hypothetical protein
MGTTLNIGTGVTSSCVTVSRVFLGGIHTTTILSCACGCVGIEPFQRRAKKDSIFSFLSPRVIGELLEDFVIAADAALDKPGACRGDGGVRAYWVFSLSSGLVLDTLEHISVEHFPRASPQNELLSCIVE